MPEFPKNPDGSNDWNTFLNNGKEYKERKIWTYEELRKDVLSKGIKSSTNYANNVIINNWPTIRLLVNMPEFPKNPDGSNDWNTFLNTGKEYRERKAWTYEELRKDVLSKGIKSSKGYDNKQKENKWFNRHKLLNMPEFPKNPDGTNDWNTFLNTGKEYRERKAWTYEELRKDVLSKGIKSSKDYSKKAMENKWIYREILTKMPEFPKNPDGSNDWGTFLGRNNK